LASSRSPGRTAGEGGHTSAEHDLVQPVTKKSAQQPGENQVEDSRSATTVRPPQQRDDRHHPGNADQPPNAITTTSEPSRSGHLTVQRPTISAAMRACVKTSADHWL